MTNLTIGAKPDAMHATASLRTTDKKFDLSNGRINSWLIAASSRSSAHGGQSIFKNVPPSISRELGSGRRCGWLGADLRMESAGVCESRGE